MNSGKIVAGRDGTGRDGWTSKVLQEVLADLKTVILVQRGIHNRKQHLPYESESGPAKIVKTTAGAL